MSAEEELRDWLNQPTKTFDENLRFGIKVCKSLEFAFQNKYEIFFDWLRSNLPADGDGKVDIALLTEVVAIEYPQHLVQPATKSHAVERLQEYVLAISEADFNRNAIDLLYTITQNQSYQIFYRSKIESYLLLQSALFKAYSRFFSKSDFSPGSAVEFYGKAVKSLREFIERSPRMLQTRKNLFPVEDLMESAIYMHSEKVFYEDLMEILKRLYFNANQHEIMFEKLADCSLAPTLYCMDFLVNYCRADNVGLKSIVRFVVENTKTRTQFQLLRAVHLFDLFRKYNVNCDFKWDTAENKEAEKEGQQTAVDVLASFVEECARKHPKRLGLMLQLVTSVLRWNPMILTRSIYRLTVQFALAEKSDADWPYFEEFLKLVIDVFKKLGRSEKLVQYLLKSLKGQLQMTGLTTRLKRKMSKTVDNLETSEKRGKLNDSSISEATDSPEDRHLETIVRSEFETPKSTRPVQVSQKWRHISMAWPAESVGRHFTEFVTSLLAKPSMVLWKTLIFSLEDALKEIVTSTDEKSLVVLDLSAALLCQYLAGSRLPEQTDKFLTEIQATRDIMQKVLQQFGRAILENEHNNRTMDAFLEIGYNVAYFDLIAAFYAPESVRIERPEIHSYLTKDEWVTLEQRIVNFGTSLTKSSFNELHLQKMKAKLLFGKDRGKALNINRYLLGQTLSDAKLLKAIFVNPLNLSWLPKHLAADDKTAIVSQLITDQFQVDLQSLENLMENREFFELIVDRFYDLMGRCFDSKKSLLKTLRDEPEVAGIVAAVYEKPTKYSIKHFEVDRLEELLDIVRESIPIGFVSKARKPKIFALTVALYFDILATKNQKLTGKAFSVLSKLLEFGESVDIFVHFNLERLLGIFPPTSFEQFYRLIFGSPQIWSGSTEAAISKLATLLETRKLELTDEDVAISVLLLQFHQQCPVKSIKKIFKTILAILVEHIENYFTKLSIGDAAADREFVRKTAPVLPFHLEHINSHGKQVEKFSEKFQEIYKKYVGYSRDTEIYTRLIGEAIFCRAQLGFDENEVELILSEMWKKLLNEARTECFDEIKAEKILKTIAGHQTNEQFIRMFGQIEETLDNLQACKMLRLFTKCSLNTYNGTILNSCCHMILFNMIMSLKKTANQTFEDTTLIASILQLMEAICGMKKHPVSVKFVDDILTFLMDVHIRHYASNSEGPTGHARFQRLHRGIIRVCSELIHCQVAIVLDRVPQFVYVFKELLYSLLTYRSSRLKVDDLEASEIEEIAALAHDLENLMHGMAKFPGEMKRIAPYLLTYCIHSMVVNSRSTVRYPKIKLHVENVCYELIPLCDHRVGSFILRCSNDATKQVYEKLSKEYKKYRKFKGKV